MIVLNVVKPGTEELLANERRRIADAKRKTVTNPAMARTVAAAIAANRRAVQRQGWRKWR